MDRIIAALLLAGTSLAVLPQYLGYQKTNLDQTIDADAASQFQTMLSGVNKYVTANSDALVSQYPLGSGAHEIPFSEIATYLPGGFSQLNVLGQTWTVYVLQPQQGQIQALVQGTGGQTLAGKDLVKIAGLTGTQGGYVPPDGLLGHSASDAVGTNWTLSLNGLPNPGSGRLFGNVTVGGSSSTDIPTNDFLYRVAVPGQESLNTMQVALNMGGNDVNSARTINAVQGIYSGDISAANGNFSGTVAAGNVNVTNTVTTRNANVSGSLTAKNANVSDTMTANTGTINDALTVGNQLSAGSAYISGQETVGSNVTVSNAGCAFNAPGTCLYGDGSNTAIRTNGAVYTQDFSGNPVDLNANHGVMQAAYLGTDNGSASKGAGCLPNGAMAASTDGSGTPLACVNGVWKDLTASSMATSFWMQRGGDANDGTVVIPNSYTHGGSCPTGTTDNLVFYASPINVDPNNNNWSGTTYVGLLHACIPT